VSISVLSTPEPIPAGDEAALLAALRPGEDGLIIEDGGRRALFLPSVWEHLPEPRLFLEQLKLKAGLPADQWSPGFTARRFRTVEVPETRRATGAAGARRRGGTPQNSEMPRSSAIPIAASAAPARR
jgi:AMMECR1 domain-containing protein